MQDQTIFELIHRMDKMNNNLIVQWNKQFNENLGISHVLILSYLRDNGKSRPSEIAKAIEITPPSMTHLSEKLVDRNLVTRQADEKDRRIIYLVITDAGMEMLGKAQQEGQKLRKALFEKLTDEEKEQLLAVYKKLTDNS